MKGIYKTSLICTLVLFLIGASVFPIISGQGETYFYANQDIPVENGGISGSYVNTQSSDDSYEGISERESGGKPSKRYSYLEHKWTIELSGSFNTLNFFIEAYHSANSEGDDFVFAYSTNDVSYSDILTVSKTADDDNYQSAELPNSLSGTIYIRVLDSDRSQGNRVLDTIFIDHMYIVGDSGPDVMPPVISDVTSSVTDDTWYKVDFEESGGVLTERELVSMTYDSGADRTILFGGTATGGQYNDTWAYNYTDNVWVNRSPSYSGGTLSYRNAILRPGFAYDPDMDRSILFGGWGGGPNFYNDTWEYNYTDNMWVNRSPGVSGGNLTPRGGVTMAYYDSVDRMIMFGGSPSIIGTYYNETWEYNYTDNMWVNRSPDVVGSLPKVYEGAMVYDSSADRIILFGGVDRGGTRYNDTWVYCYGNNTWWKRNPGFVGGTLSPRQWHGMVYDSGADRTILFGGADPVQLNDTWVYNYSDNTWYNVDFSEVGDDFYPREAMGLAYDSSSGKTVMACGFYGAVPDLNDTWLFSSDSDDPIATITWTTDEPSDSVVNYGTTTALGNTTSDSTLVTNHQIMLTDILPNTTYYYEVQSTDASNNTATDNNNGSYYTFPDMTPPVISNVASSEITYNSAKITWGTDESSNSRVNYGTTIALGDTEFNSAMVTSHSIVLSDLLPEITYYYEVVSTDGDGNTAIDNNSGTYYSFTTDSEPSNVMHVYSIDMWYTQSKNKVTIYSRVKIVDAGDNAVEGATVDIDLATPNNGIIAMSDVTDSNGEVTFTYGPTPKTGTYTTTVTDVVKSDWVYNSGDNVETSDQLIVP